MRAFAFRLSFLLALIGPSGASLAQPLTGAPEFRVATEVGGNQWAPEIAIGEQGDYVMAWTSEAGARAQLFDRSGQRVGGELDVGPPWLSKVGMDADGDFVVITGTKGVPFVNTFARRFDRRGAAIGSAFQVAGNSYYDPALSVSRSGSFVVVWASYSGAAVRLQRYDAEGAPIRIPSSSPAASIHRLWQ